MSYRHQIGWFEDERSLLAAARECRSRGIRIDTVHSPHPVHGLDEVLGYRPSRLPYVCFAGGVTGLALGLGMQYWTSAVDWPLNVGGMPFDSLPAFVPVAFEVTVLFAGLSTAFFLLAASRLWPGKTRAVPHGATDDRYALVLRQEDAAFEVQEFHDLWLRHGAVDHADGMEADQVNDIKGFFVAALVVIVTLTGLHVVTRRDTNRRNLEIFTEMVYSPARESFTASAYLPASMTMQPLVPGVVVRGRMPFAYGPGPEEAARAGAELSNPFTISDAKAAERGAEVFRIYCAVCHDAGGGGRGSVVARGVLPPPSLQSATSLQMSDGEMFHLLTLGRGNMASYAAQLEPDDRWQAILHVRRLQKEAGE